jgi:NADH:ubiquinone oxidoreductase subunit 4 (subunit M)
MDLFLFSCFFEGLLILIFFLIIFYGSRLRRVKALTYFVIYTIIGSGFLFFSLLIIYFELQTFTFFIFILPLNILQSYLI